MVSILNDSMLNNLKCTVCEKYLSVLPVKVYSNRVIKCGRCCKENDGGIKSLYNSVVKNCLFRCVNRYEGCNKLLTVYKTRDHELSCFSKIYNCPKCECKFSGSAYHLILHYNKQHPKSILKYNNFPIIVKQDFRERYLYLMNNKIFLVLVDNLAAEKTLYLSAVSLICYRNITQWFSVKSVGESPFSTIAEKKLCRPLEQFQCDYFSIQTNSKNEVSCRLHLDLSEDICAIDQISINQKKISADVQQQTDDISLVSISTQTLPVTSRISTLNSADQTPKKVTTEVQHQMENTSSVSISVQTKQISYRRLRLPGWRRNTIRTCAQTTPVEDVFGVKLTDDFRKDYPNYKLTPCGTALFKDDDRIELVCSNCKQLTACNVFNCQLNKHIVCWDCKAWCGICNSPTNGWNVRISNINELLLLPCKWQCRQYFLGNSLRQHELCCEKPIRKCPLCCDGRGMNLEQLTTHLIAYHRNYKNMTTFNITGYLRECQGRTQSKDCFFHGGFWFYLTWIKNQTVYEIVIKPFDDVNLFELAVICDTDQQYNKVESNAKVTFALIDNPRFYLKRVRNL